MKLNSKLLLLTLFVIPSLLLLQGCASVARFNVDYEEIIINQGVYPATKSDLGIFSASQEEHWGSGLAKMLTPFAIIDIPFSLITDTVMLPYDWYHQSKFSDSKDFWAMVASTQDVSLPMDQYQSQYNLAGSYLVLKQIMNNSNSQQLRLYFDVANANIELKRSQQIIEKAIEQAQNMPELSAYICNTVAQDIDRPQFQIPIHLMMKGYSYPATCVTTLAEAGLSCEKLLDSENLSVDYINKCYNDDRGKFINWLVRNPSVPAEIHEDIYLDTIKKQADLIQQYGSLQLVPGGHMTRETVKQIARNTSSRTLIDQFYEMDTREMNSSLMANKFVEDEIKTNIKQQRNWH